MNLLLDIGNTHTHAGLGNQRRVLRQVEVPTAGWFDGSAATRLDHWIGRSNVEAVAVCSVVPRATPPLLRWARRTWKIRPVELNARTVTGVGIDYPKPASIGPDRLANAIAVRARHGAPAIAVDFGTAVTFDVLDRRGNYVGGVIAPGLSAMTSYLHEKTALLPRIDIREIRKAIGRSTEEAMLIGAVHGYRGLIREILAELRRELHARKLPVVATGGYAKLMAAGVPEIGFVEPDLTLEGLRQFCLSQ